MRTCPPQHVRVSFAELPQEMVEAVHLLRLICFDNQSGGNTPPEGKVPEFVLTAPPDATKDASDDPFIKAAAKCRARCHGPTSEVINAQPLLELDYKVSA